MDKTLKVGVIGCGFISPMHLGGYSKINNVKIVALCDIIEEKAMEKKSKYGDADTKIFTDYKKMLKEVDFDIVSVCTENCLHAEISIDALNAGANVFCEKPMAITGKEADAMVEAAKKNNRKLSVGYQLRFQNEAMLLRHEVVSDKLGKIYYAEATALRRRGVPNWGVFLNKQKQNREGII